MSDVNTTQPKLDALLAVYDHEHHKHPLMFDDAAVGNEFGADEAVSKGSTLPNPETYWRARDGGRAQRDPGAETHPGESVP